MGVIVAQVEGRRKLSFELRMVEYPFRDTFQRGFDGICDSYRERAVVGGVGYVAGDDTREDAEGFGETVRGVVISVTPIQPG